MKKRIIINEEVLLSLIYGAIKENLEKEGINVSPYGDVSMTDEHEERVNTSIVKNPTCTKDIVPSIEVWSLFLRKDGYVGDGNPLLYGLKKEKGYNITNPKMVYGRIEQLIDKFIKEHSNMTTTIAIPSTNQLNKYLLDAIRRRSKGTMVIDNLLVKMTIDEVDEYVRSTNSPFREKYGIYYPQKYEIFQNYCKKMMKLANDDSKYDFRLHLIEDMEMRKLIDHTIKIKDNFYGAYMSAINGKDILILDDSITTGQSIKEATKIIADCYEPKSITVLTLMSPLYNNKETKLKDIPTKQKSGTASIPDNKPKK